MIELECRWNDDPIALRWANERFFQQISKYKNQQLYWIRNMQSNPNCTSRKFFISFHDIMKNQYPEEDIQGVYIQTLLFIKESIRKKKIEAMIYGSNQFVCNKCKKDLEVINFMMGGLIETFSRYRHQGHATEMTLAQLKEKLVYEMKERQKQMKRNCLCKKKMIWYIIIQNILTWNIYISHSYDILGSTQAKSATKCQTSFLSSSNDLLSCNGTVLPQQDLISQTKSHLSYICQSDLITHSLPIISQGNGFFLVEDYLLLANEKDRNI